MVELKRTDLSVRAEQAILIGVSLPEDEYNEEELLQELSSLAKTAGARVVGSVWQKRSKIDATYYVGKGKAEEIAQMVKALNTDVLVTDHDLTPAQVRTLEKIMDIKVVDRTELILDIFATRAKTHQARVQVELAQLEYAFPRLMRMWTHLSRIEGGMTITGGIATRGPGEKQLEVDRRLVTKRITDLKKELKEIEKRKEREVRARNENFTVSLVGYTNAGKSTLMNALTGANVTVEDKLFATLDTKTRTCTVGEGREILLSDTVGFIRRLPHHLVASFHATLEEVQQADLLLHLVDVSSPQAIHQAESVDQILRDLKYDNKPTIVVLNKVDALNDESILPIFRRRYPNNVLISARTRQGISELKEKICDVMDKRRSEVTVSSYVGNGRLFAYLCEKGQVLNRRYDGQRAFFRVRIDSECVGKLKKFDPNVEITPQNKSYSNP